MNHTTQNICKALIIFVCMLTAFNSYGSKSQDLYFRISMIYVDDKPRYVYSEGRVQPIEFTLPEGSHKLKFCIIAESASGKTIEYSTRLQGFDNDWSAWSTQREINYCNVQGGNYTFQAKAKNSDMEITNPLEFHFNVESSFAGHWFNIVVTTIGIVMMMLVAGIAVKIYDKNKLSKLQYNLDKCMHTLQETSAKLSSQQETHNKNIQVLSLLSKAGQNIIKNFTLKDIYKTTYEEINKFFATDNIRIGIYNGPHESLDFSSFIMNGEHMPFARHSLGVVNNMEVYCYTNKKTVVMDDYQRQTPKYIDTKKYTIDSQIVGSAVFMPLYDNEMTIGVLTIMNKNFSYFNSYHLGIIHNIASYLETAIVNFSIERKAIRRQKMLEERTINLQKTYNDLKKSQAELQTMSTALTNIDNSVVILNKSGNLIWGNVGFQKIYGYTFEEYVKDNTFYMEAVRHKEMLKYFTDALEKNKSYKFTLLHKRKDGSEIWTQTTLTPILDKKGKLVQLVSVDTDVTSIKKAEAEITKQRNEIESKNKDLTKSIEYASSIQNALMTAKDLMKKYFKKSFYMNLPKDIVAGDFLWVGEKFGRKYVALCDCAGHGVPGAFLSIMGKVFLDEILISLKVEQNPSDIIRLMNDKLYKSINSLSSKVGGIDGMDMSVCMFNSRNTFLHYAGAYRPLYLIRNKNIIVIPPEKSSVGNIPPDEDFVWETHEMTLKENDFIYLSSDGYADQFSFERNKKMGRKRFYQLLIDSTNLNNADEIQKFFYDKHIEWRGQEEQLDDISIACISISPPEEQEDDYDEEDS